MELKQADVDGARPESYFRQVRQLVAIAATENFQKYAVPEFATLGTVIDEEVKALALLADEAEAIFYAQLREDRGVRNDAETIDTHIAAANQWCDEATASLNHAHRQGVDGADAIRDAIEPASATAAGTMRRVKILLDEAARVDLPAFFLHKAWYERGMELIHLLADRPNSLYQNTFDREHATRRLRALCAQMGKHFLSIASANEVVRFRVGARAIGFDFGIIKSDRPDGPEEEATPPLPTPPAPTGPSFRVVGGEPDDE